MGRAPRVDIANKRGREPFSQMHTMISVCLDHAEQTSDGE